MSRPIPRRRTPRARCVGLSLAETEPLQIGEHTSLQQLLRRHRERAATGVAPPEERGDAVGERPDVERHHERRWPAVLGEPRADRLRRLAPHREGALAGEPAVAAWRQASLAVYV